MIEFPLKAKTAARARGEIKARWTDIDVAYYGYDADGFCVFMSLVCIVTKGNVAAAKVNRGKRAVRFTASPQYPESLEQ